MMGKKARISAVTFDLWDTLIIDDSDEPKRAAEGMASKARERRNLVERFLQKTEPTPRALIDVAYDTLDAAFRHVWYNQDVTWTVSERLSLLLAGLKRELLPEDFEELVRLHEEMELMVRPDLVSGVTETLRTLKDRYRLGVISDAIFSPGRVLRQILSDYGAAGYFDSFVFSDEAGRSKPHPLTFEKAAADLGVKLDEIVHIGDREEKDVRGPHSVGARAVLFTAVKDRGSQNTKADAVCENIADLPRILDGMNSH